jgi:LmbE family N-acetylglucosaminyl deacetylase
VSLAPITLSIDIAPYLNAKLAAFRAHETQGPIFPLFEQNVLRQGGKEFFHLAATIAPQAAKQEQDLFEGVTE